MEEMTLSFEKKKNILKNVEDLLQTRRAECS